VVVGVVVVVVVVVVRFEGHHLWTPWCLLLRLEGSEVNLIGHFVNWALFVVVVVVDGVGVGVEL
jgi:hypothetical protein